MCVPILQFLGKICQIDQERLTIQFWKQMDTESFVSVAL